MISAYQNNSVCWLMYPHSPVVVHGKKLKDHSINTTDCIAAAAK